MAKDSRRRLGDNDSELATELRIWSWRVCGRLDAGLEFPSFVPACSACHVAGVVEPVSILGREQRLALALSSAIVNLRDHGARSAEYWKLKKLGMACKGVNDMRADQEARRMVLEARVCPISGYFLDRWK